MNIGSVHTSRLSWLQREMQQKGISICIIPHADAHQSEYISPDDALVEWYSGFTGSAGTLVVGLNSIGLWTDGRYAIQAKIQLADTPIHLFIDGYDNVVGYDTWIEQGVAEGDVIGVDASVFSYKQYKAINELCVKNKLHLNATFQPINELWKDKPTPVYLSPFVLEEKFSGEHVRSKLQRVRTEIAKLGATCCLVSALDEIAWLLNCRGSDIEYNPVFKSFLFIKNDTLVVFLHQATCSPQVISYLVSIGVEIAEYDAILPYLHTIRNVNVVYDADKVSAALLGAFDSSVIKIETISPIARLKSIKNESEIHGCKNAMRKDGVVWVKLWRWLEDELVKQKVVTEEIVAKKLTELKKQQEGFVCESFKSIVAYAQNAAICHYAIANNKLIESSSLVLIDTGTHYVDGTTDTTRVIALGELSSLQKKEITLVLKGHIALAQAVFLKGTKGFQLDALARQFLWKEGYDYAHGTGHGVGHCLNVHEGYASISPRAVQIALQAGMFITNEPGLYKENEYGVRIENVMLVKQVESDTSGRLLHFDTLTLCPLDTRMIDKTLMTDEEHVWVEKYQQKVCDELSPLLDDEERDWLKEKTSYSKFNY
jgi:Xaa-Pro aminopeptidase